MFLGNSTGPNSGSRVFKRFWFTNSLEWLSVDRLHQVEYFDQRPSVGFGPIAQIIAKLGGDDRLKNFILLYVFQRQIPYATRRPLSFHRRRIEPPRARSTVSPH